MALVGASPERNYPCYDDMCLRQTRENIIEKHRGITGRRGRIAVANIIRAYVERPTPLTLP